MANHTVTLNWISGGLKPDTDPLLVKAGDTISFQLGSAPPDSKLRVKMNAPGVFSPAEVTDSYTTLTVIEAAITTYACELSDAVGGPLFASAEGEGGHVRPG